jgi:hypothetical protein
MVRLRDIQPITEETHPVDVQSNEVNDVPLIHFNSKLDGLDEKVLDQTT